MSFVMTATVQARSQTQSALMIIVATYASVLLVACISLEPAANLGKLFSARPARWIGQRSYGIYLYHLPILSVFVVWCHWHGLPRDSAALLCVVVVILLADLSYRFVELPFLRLKARFDLSRNVEDRRETGGGQLVSVAPPTLAEASLNPASP